MKRVYAFSQFFILLFLLFSGMCYGGGQFQLRFERPEKATNHEHVVELELKKEFSEVVSGINEALRLPYDIHIIFRNDKRISPYYNPRTHEIIMPYEFLELTERMYKKISVKQDGSELEYSNEYLVNVNIFILYHEMGHALIDAYNLPVLGQQEDAADNIAVVFALEFEEEDYDVLIDSADFFDMIERIRGDRQESDFWDEHALDAQRYYRIVCMAYGMYPKEVGKLLAEEDDEDLDVFVKKKGKRCQFEVHNTIQSTVALLKPHMVEKFERGDKATPSTASKSSDEDEDDSDDDEDDDEEDDEEDDA